MQEIKGGREIYVPFGSHIFCDLCSENSTSPENINDENENRINIIKYTVRAKNL
jgi:hypothetical protein